ncbi:MAG TPA: PIN domain-containing protein [Tepidisphaeraceae bacterium]|nr:PIN domain-containing protein [Tepidisphaeraceae bacterium]
MSRPVFVDTFALLAMLNTADARHEAAMRWFRVSTRPLVVNEWVLTELADALCAVRTRQAAVAVERRMRSERRVTVIESSADLFGRGFDLYANRPDQEWSLTDCISFVVMKDRHIKEALTGDHHFEQAGFVALLK